MLWQIIYSDPAQDTADLWNTDQVQLDELFRQLLAAPAAAATDPHFGAGGIGGIGCGAATRSNLREARKGQARRRCRPYLPDMH